MSCPCKGCRHSIGGVDCRLNLEMECREGGGYEAWEAAAPQKPKDDRRYKIMMWSVIIFAWFGSVVAVWRLVELIGT